MSMKDVDKILQEIYLPRIQEQINHPSLVIGDGWPRTWVLFPRIWKIEYKIRWARRDLKEWWSTRPTWIGGTGPWSDY